MKKLMMFLFVLGVLPVTVMAQDDDMYFVPSKENKAKEAKTYGMPAKTYYSGSQRSVDDYNRRAWSSATPIDSAGNDIIDFSAVRGVYPDSTLTEVAADDYRYTRRMSRFDDYTPSQAYWEGYTDGRWMSPWYRTSWYSWYDYDPWYWDSPWYYGGYYSWYSPWHYGYYRPWHYGYYGYYGPYWYGGGRHYNTYTSRPIRRTTYQSGRSFGRTNSRTTYNSNRSFGQPSRSSSSSSSFGGSHRSSGSGSSRSSSGGGRSFGGRR